MLKGSAIIAAEKIFRTEYNKAVAEYDATNAWDALAMLGTEIPSSGAEEDYRWLQEMPEFDEWIGDLNVADLKDYHYTIRNVLFAAAVGIFRTELEDDKYNVIMPRIRGMAGGEMRKWGKLVHTLIQDGTSKEAFDGVAFFSNATGDRKNDNLLEGTISAANPTAAQVAADIRMVRKAMLGFKNSRGEIVGIIPDTYVVPPNLETLFRQLQESTADPTNANAGTKNPYSSYIKKVIVDPGAEDDNDFYAFATTYSVGPFVRQKRSAVETFLDSTQMYVNNKLTFGAEFRGNVGYGLPIMGCKVVSSVS